MTPQQITRKITLLTVFLLMCFSSLFGKHITSGYMEYICKGNGNYDFKLKLERDCYGGGATFDSNITISIFTENGLYQDFVVELSTTEKIIFNPYENCDPSASEFCLESTVYKFSANLVNDGSTYQISYQRCCWANDILNILDPELNGITVTTEIGPESLEICNSSPINQFPLSFPSCPGQIVSLDLPLLDSDGDSLSYAFCFPLAGGGLKGTAEEPGSAIGCDGVTPINCPPPYAALQFNEGFSLDYPFPTENGFEINNESGTFSFITSEQGRFIYSFCISEFRDGVEIGLHRKTLFFHNSPNFISNQKDQNIENSFDIQYFASSKTISIINTNNHPATASIYNIDGKLCMSKTEFTTDTTISTQYLPTGIYVVNILSANGSSKVEKLLIW